MSFGRPRAAAKVGDPVDAIDTPALVIDLDAMERNLVAMAAFASERGMRLRPHAKMHKSAEISKLQIAAGAVGVCVQKLSEAEILSELGVPDIFISNEIVDVSKLARVAALAGHIKLAIAVDSRLGVERLEEALSAAGTMLDVFVEIDVGQGRCGVAPAGAGALAHQVVSRGLRFAGLQAYHGLAQHLRTYTERERTIQIAASQVRDAQVSLADAGVNCPLVTGAGTGTFEFEASSGVWGELQCGSYLFMDRDYAENERGHGKQPRFEHALFVKSQVTSLGAAHAVVDAGHKSHAIDSGPPSVWQRGLQYGNGGDEHGILTRQGHAGVSAELPQLGETVWLVPGHCDPTVNLHDRFVVVRGGLQHGTVQAIWNVEARGCAS